MHPNRKIILAALGTVGALALATAFAHTPDPAHAGHGTATSPSMQLHHAMMKPMADMQMTGDVDRDFASMMQDHHRQAIEMADIVIANGDDEALIAMARKMKETQAAEIVELQAHD